MTRRLLLSYLTITALVLALLVVPLGLSFAEREKDRLTTDLERDATVLASLSEESLEDTTSSAVEATVAEYSERTGARAVIVDDQGISVADSDALGEPRRDFSTRPEIEAALTGERTTGTRHSETLDTDLLYVAVPVFSGETIHGAVRLSYPTSELDERIRQNWLRLAGLSLVVLAVVAAVGVVLARSVTRPVTDLERATAAMSRGDLTQRVATERGPPELRSLGRSFNEMAARLDELVGAQTAFVADASHQLRTPLTALRLRLENVEAGVDQDAATDLRAAIDETNRLSRLVDGLLLLARSEGGRPACEEVALGPTVAERCEVWQPLAQERGVSIAFRSPPDSSVVALPGAVEQMVDNLIDNALEVSPQGGTIEVGIEREPGGVVLHVVDEGPGLDEEERRRAFDRFWRGPGAAPGGSGLGLAVVRQLATRCDAVVDLAPAPTTGLEATVTFRPSS